MGVLWKVEGVGVIEDEDERLLIASDCQSAAAMSEDVVVVHSVALEPVVETRTRSTVAGALGLLTTGAQRRVVRAARIPPKFSGFFWEEL